MSNYMITPEEISSNSVSSAPDILEGNPQDNKAIFDRLGNIIAQRHNILGLAVTEHGDDVNNPHAVTAQQIGALGADSLKPGDNIIITKNPDGTVTIISTGGGGSGGGDMYRSVYDTDSDGVVDSADHAVTADHAIASDNATVAQTATVADRAILADNGIGGYIHTVESGNHILEGIGTTANFKATATASVNKIKVNGVNCSVVQGDETDIELVAGRWYSFILDIGSNTVNFSLGGVTVNYKLVGGTTEPINPKENTIWVNTDAEMADFSIEATNGFAEPNEGDVWISTNIDADVSFTVDKKHRLMIYPAVTYQYINGVWAVKEARLFTGISWKQFSFNDLAIFNNGDYPIEWVEADYTTNGQGANSFSLNNRINILANYAGGSLPRVVAAVTDTAIDITGYNTIFFEISQDSTASSYYLGVNDTKQTDATGKMVKHIVTQTKGISSLDVSDITGEMYVMVLCAGASIAPSVSVHAAKIWLSGELL